MVQSKSSPVSDKPSPQSGAPSAAPRPGASGKKPVSAKEACALCGKLCKGARGLASHNATCHNCHYCSQVVLDVAEHVRRVHESEACGECARRFPSPATLEAHMEEEHLVTCDLCQENFFNAVTMAEHRREEHEMEDCDMCDERFLKTEKLMDGHLESVHGIKARTIKQFAGGHMFMMMDE
jgi:hypothetical protein